MVPLILGNPHLSRNFLKHPCLVVQSLADARESQQNVLHLAFQGVFLWTLRVCTLGFWVPKPWILALNKGIWDPKLRGTNIKSTNLKSLSF